MTMTHPGLPVVWVVVSVLAMIVCSLWVLTARAPEQFTRKSIAVVNWPVIGPLVRYLTRQIWLLLFLKIVFVLLFVLIIIAGLWGSPLPERNIATVLTWNIWWTGVIISVVFFGSAWCAVCPWDTISNWLVRHRLWHRSNSSTQLHRAVPAVLRSLFPALLMLMILTWLELGIGVTESPYATAVLALMMVVLATLSLVLFEGKAFCRYICPVGRTIGVYGQLAPVELRPIDTDICRECDSLACFHGTQTIDPCPTKLVMGRLQESTYCISCGNCTQSCPDKNIAWRLRTPSVEVIQDARPHLDESFFLLGLLALTSFHGLTMLPEWQEWISTLGRLLDDSGQLLMSFSVSLFGYVVLLVGFFAGIVLITKQVAGTGSFARTFSVFAFSALPLAFAYHLAHNLNHLLRETSNLFSLLLNPLGIDTQPLSLQEKHERANQLLISEDWLFGLQACLMMLGFSLALQVIRYRGFRQLQIKKIKLAPMVIFLASLNTFHLWLLMQPMTMRM
jgi:polyferredoxin